MLCRWRLFSGTCWPTSGIPSTRGKVGCGVWASAPPFPAPAQPGDPTNTETKAATEIERPCHLSHHDNAVLSGHDFLRLPVAAVVDTSIARSALTAREPISAAKGRPSPATTAPTSISSDDVVALFVRRRREYKAGYAHAVVDVHVRIAHHDLERALRHMLQRPDPLMWPLLHEKER